MNEKFGSGIIILKLNIFFLTFQHFRIDHNAPCVPPQFCKTVLFPMNDFPVIGDPCFAHRILGSPGGKHCESLQRNVWRGVVSPLKAVSLDTECRILQ